MIQMKYLSLFTGIGGFELGIGPKHECIGYSEIDKYAVQIYQSHFPNHTNYGDITKIDASTLPDFDLLVGGFPCQSFSIAGKRRGFEDTRGTLFFDIARILKSKRPRLLLLENVKGLLSHDNGGTFKTIISALDELGYDLQWQVLNSKDFGVPQNRERILIVGHLRGTPRPQVFPFGEGDSWAQDTRGTEREEVANTLKAKQGGPDLENSYLIPEATKKGFAEANPGDSINLSVMSSKTRRGRIGKGLAQTLDTGMQQHTISSGGIRRLTPIECERLQGFPDGWTKYGFTQRQATAEDNLNGRGDKLDYLLGAETLISDTQRYKCLGNAVTTNVIRAITERLLDN